MHLSSCDSVVFWGSSCANKMCDIPAGAGMTVCQQGTPDQTDHMHSCEKIFAQSLYKHYIIENPRWDKDNQIERKAHAYRGSKFPPQIGSLGNPDPGGSAPTFLLYWWTSFYYVPSARSTHFVRDRASSTPLKLVGGSAPEPPAYLSTGAFA